MEPNINIQSVKTFASLRKRAIIFLKLRINEKEPDDPLLYMAKAADKLGYNVEIVTSKCRQKFIDKELKNITVSQVCRFIPEHICGYGHVILYFLRILYMIFWILIMKNYYLQPTYIVTQTSIGFLPLFKLKGSFTVVQIYTFDDEELISTSCRGIIKKRNIICHICMRFADKIIVHDKLSKTVFKKVFSLQDKNPIILYPCTTGTSFEESPVTPIQNFINVHNKAILLVCFGQMCRNSNFELCVQAFSLFMEVTKVVKPYFYYNTFLIIASQYDGSKSKEYVKYYKRLKCFTKNCCTNKASVIFLHELPSSYKKTLISKCDAVLFPMVCLHSRTILEAGFLKKPVIALNSGVAPEYIQSGLNGFLVTANAKDFATSMAFVLYHRDSIDARSHDIFIHVQKNFGLNEYFRRFRHIIARNSQCL